MATGDDRVGLLFWEMTLKDDEFNAKIKDAEKSLDDLDDKGGVSLGKLSSKFAVVGTAVAGVAAGLAALSVNAIEQVAQQKILADSIGATTAEVEGLTTASEQLVGDAGMVIDKMREFGGINEFKKLADDVKNAGDETDQLAKAVELFGGEGARMLPVLQLGSEGLKEFEEQALETGKALSPEQTEKAAEAYRSWNELTAHATGLTRELGVALSGFIPILTEGVKKVREMVNATGEIVDGFRIWRDEVLGIEDPFSKAVTAEEILARKTELATRELEKQKNALNGLGKETEKTFSSGLFAAEARTSMLSELQEELGLTEKGLSKISGMAAEAFGRGETVGDVADAVRELSSLKTQSFFSAEDFKAMESFNVGLGMFGGKGEDPAKKVEKSTKKTEKAMDDLFKRQRDKMKELMQQQADAPQFAQMATRGSVAEFKILQQNDKKTEKSIERNTKRVADLIAKWETV